MKITADHIYTCVPHANALIVNALIRDWHYAEEHDIITPRHTAWFLGNAAHETTGFTRLEENLYYTTARRLHEVWPSRFPTTESAAPYIKNPKALANFAYGRRLGNERDGISDDDGWDYRGSGIFQTTGYDNFLEVQNVTGIKCADNPELLRSMPSALIAAAVFWQKRDLGKYADANRYEGITKAINGGLNGLAERRLYIDRFMRALSANSGAPVLKRGSRGPEVLRAQKRLQELGYYEGELDGDFGPGMYSAVCELQEKRGVVPVDGVIGPNTSLELWRDPVS